MAEPDLMGRCTAHNKRGSQCEKTAVPGAKVCYYHGGKAPQVVAKARLRLLEAADPAAAKLVKLALGAESEAVALAAVRDILDRAGLKVAESLNLTGSVDVTSSLAELMGRIQAVAARVEPKEIEAGS